MKKFRIDTESSVSRVRVVASTRAGFMTVALEGMFAASKVLFVETDIETRFVAQESERPFKITADDFPHLLATYLEEALKQAKSNNEAYVGLRLSLITDKQAEGAFLGQPVAGFDREIIGVVKQGLKVEKNQLGYWESTITFKE